MKTWPLLCILLSGIAWADCPADSYGYCADCSCTDTCSTLEGPCKAPGCATGGPGCMISSEQCESRPGHTGFDTCVSCMNPDPPPACGLGSPPPPPAPPPPPIPTTCISNSACLLSGQCSDDSVTTPGFICPCVICSTPPPPPPPGSPPPPSPPSPPPPPPGSPPPPPPALGPCGAAIICGDVHAAENPAMLLDDIVIEIRDLTGKVKGALRTNAAGHYSYASTERLWIVVVVNRGQYATPGQAVANPSEQKDFSVGRIPLELTVRTASPGTFALVSTDPITTPMPPDINSNTPKAYMSAVADESKVARLKPYPGFLWYLTCWNYVVPAQGMGKFQKADSIPVPGTPADPRTQITMDCPL